jgi:hypothetical protein
VSALDDIRDDLKTVLAAVSGLHAHARVPARINPPAAVIAPDSVEYNVDFDGGATYRLPVQVLVQLGDWDAAQQQLDALVAHDGTAVDAINSATVEARVTSMEGYGLTPYAGVDYLGAVLIVEVLT